MEDNKVRKIAISVVKLIFIEGVFLYLFNFFLDVVGLKNIVSTFFHSKKLLSFLSYPIPLWEVIVSFIVFIILILLFNFYRTKIISKPIKTRQEKIYDLIDEFKLKYKYMKIDNFPIEYRTYISLSDDSVLLNTVEPYCTNHEVRLKMVGEDVTTHYMKGYVYCCPEGCGNVEVVDLESKKNIILSTLENEWDKSLKEIL